MSARALAMAWFLSGKPRWYRRPKGYCTDVGSAPGDCFTYEVGGKPGRFFDGKPRTGPRAGMGYVVYDVEHKGWTANYGLASYGGHDLLHADGDVLDMFDTAEEAKAAVERVMPKFLDDYFRDMAKETVATLGFWRIRDRRFSINELLRQFWEHGGPRSR